MPNTSEVPATIRRITQQRAISDARLAELSAMARASLVRKLAGGSDFTVSELIRIADALGVEPATLLGADAA
jgi:transcriptional regulator with XRE-family HTH domain